MRIENDYIMRQVAQLVQAIARALGLAEQGRSAEAIAAVDEALVSVLGSDYEHFSPDELVARVCGPNSNLTSAGFDIATLLTQAGHIRASQGQHAGARNHFEQSLALTKALMDDGGTPVPWNVGDRLAELTTILSRGDQDQSDQQ